MLKIKQSEQKTLLDTNRGVVLKKKWVDTRQTLGRSQT